MQTFLMAFRSVFRNKRRSALNIAALTMGMIVMFLGLGWVNGYHTYIYQSLMDFDTGSAQILNAGYQDQARRFPLDLNVAGYASFRETLLSDSEIEAASGRVNFSGTISVAGKSVPVGVNAVDPPHEAEVTVLRRQVMSGDYLADDGGILIGKTLADKLGVEPGDVVFLTAVDRYGVSNFVDLTVAGLFSYGYPMMDDGQVFIDLGSSWNLLGLDDEVSRVVVSLRDGIDPIAWASRHRDDWSSSGLRAYQWKTFAQTAVAAVEGDSGSFYIMLVVMYLLATVGMLNSMSMSMHERIREFGTLRAIGMKKWQLLRLIVIEGLCIALISTVLAAVVSAPLTYWLQGIGFSFNEIMDAGLPIPFGERFRADFNASQAALSILTALAAATLGSFVPALRIARHGVAESLAGER
ncbi:MAG: ABC transporter permease [Spirochaetales bacterium]|nr:MAG: ABC transporter permease [Spirochaetales bacterium]